MKDGLKGYSENIHKPPFLAGLIMGSLTGVSITATVAHKDKQAIRQAVLEQLEAIVSEVPELVENFIHETRTHYEQRVMEYVGDLEESMGLSEAESQQLNSALQSVVDHGEQMALEKLKETDMSEMVLKPIKKLLKRL